MPTLANLLPAVISYGKENSNRLHARFLMLDGYGRLVMIRAEVWANGPLMVDRDIANGCDLLRQETGMKSAELYRARALEFFRLSAAKLSQVATGESFEKIATPIYLFGQVFDGDAKKTALWFRTKTPCSATSPLET
jgi:hypothetical protein